MSPPTSRTCTKTAERVKNGKKMEAGLLKKKKEENKVKVNIRIATINVRTCQDDMKLVDIVKAASDLKIDVLAFQEARKLGKDEFTFKVDPIQGWHVVWSGHKRKKEHGVAILLAPHVKLEEFTEHLAARIISTKICVRGLKLSILNAYAPTDSTKSDAAKSSFYSALSKAKKYLDESPKFKVVTTGDFNATISSMSKDSGAWDKVLGHNNSDRLPTSNNGERLLMWCLKNNIQLVNTMFRSKRIHRGTWFNEHTKKWKRIDYIGTCKWLLRFVRSCRVFIGPSALFQTDHRLLVMNIDFPATKRELNRYLPGKTREPKPKIDFIALREDVDLQNKLTQELEKELAAQEDTQNVDTLNSNIVNSVKACVENVCPKIQIKVKKEPWEDEELQKMKEEVRKCKKRSDLRIAQKKVKNRRKWLKKKYYKELANEINTAAEARKAEKEFALAKKFNMLKDGSKKCISNEKLKQHFEKHFSARPIPLPPELERPEEYSFLAEEKIPINEDVPAEKEVKDAVRTFKDGKNWGSDKMKTEGLKYNSSNLLLGRILALLTLIWSILSVPSAWLHSNITCLYKKGIKSVASNYRGISIGANMSRILSKIIIGRIKESYEKHICKFQFGFRISRSTSDGIYMMKNIIQKSKDPLIAVYVDLTAAYDHIPRDFLFRVLDFRLHAPHIVKILQLMYHGTTASIKGMRSVFEVLIGCRQGGQESPCLFNYYFDFVLKVAAHEIDLLYPDGWGVHFEYNIPHTCSNREQRRAAGLSGIEVIKWILYADDMVVFAKNVEEAEKILKIISDTCKRFGLTVSFGKTKTQVFYDAELASRPSLFKIDGNVVENVTEFTYLGHVISNSEDVCFTEHRVSRATAKFNELRNVLCDVDVNLKTRRKILEACVRSRLLYGTSAWDPKEDEIRKLEVCWNECLRSMVKGGWKRLETDDENEYKFVYSNLDLEGILHTSPLRQEILSQRMKYLGHVCRKENTASTKRMMFAKSKRLYVRDPWKKIASLMGIEVSQLLKMTQSRPQYRAFVNLMRPTSKRRVR